ncbi:SulP family inorganic anion transporter [Adhaeretor mobilis]|uniref:C4-dicarboxylic acid transporter DauA n=1 Tax=Adhaeretor mobilis TaxID=1930276 RepID=A0A517MZC5_9BACT|nr:SulP family inorganic anion transporter [Adhaeretor mobilis]QDT00240.1 C4-dicarboxylic acid transporter DauA [Adhaeretor mobilis]
MLADNNGAQSMAPSETPRGDVAGFKQYFKQDVLSGFLVFLIALPLCLGIALACGYPAIAGIFTAIIGAIVATFISDSELTIKGPAAGLIVIAIGCVEAFGGDGPMGGFSEADMSAYKMALAVGVAAAILQIIAGLFRSGILAEFFPLAAVHGMLAAIGVIIMVKQIPIALGVRGAKGEPLEMIKEIPHFFKELNPEIALVGGISLLIMFLWPWAKKLHPLLKAIPAPMIVLLVAVPLGMLFDLQHTHIYTFHGHKYKVGEVYLVTMPDRVFGMFDYITYPDFSALKQPTAWKWVFMFFIIGSLESLLSAKAIDLLDPWKRKTNLNRDLVAVGVGNLACSLVGGLPMISEIVRSKANIDNGARTRFADFWHGIFLLLCVALIPTILHLIPLAALAAMLVYTGFRLAHPTEFLHVLKVGKEQLLIFVVTLVAVLATDLLIGIGIGVAVKMMIHLVNGVPLRSLFKPYLDVENQDGETVIIAAQYSAVFSNWILFRKQLVDLGLMQRKNVILDLAQTKLVDHSVMEKLHEIQADFTAAELDLQVVGLEHHHGLSSHELSAQKLSAIGN